MSTPTTGRFAPSPTGPLHFGSLVAALASWLDARAAGGSWLVRIEDLDTPRCEPGASDTILRQLEGFGLTWDGEILYQSARGERYAEALEALAATGLTYPCACSRREIADSSPGIAYDGAPIYPGTCRNGLAPGRHARAVRIRAPGQRVTCSDRIQGNQTQDIAAEVGDFVLRRADGLFAYQLAVVVDDHDQGITDVVRGADLLDSTPRQIWLSTLLGFRIPRYAHIPAIVNSNGEKLSKQTGAMALETRDRGALLRSALRQLGHDAPADAEPLEWARAHWDIRRVPRVRFSLLDE